MRDNDPRYLAAVEYEYITESFDRRLEGRFNSHDEWIPFDMARSCNHASAQSGIISRKHRMSFSKFKNYLDYRKMTYKGVTEEYKRLIEPFKITISKKQE